jgi:hypothetical protein
MTPTGAKPRDAGPEDSGRACPYCRFAMKPGTPVVDCAACSATHHSDCWGDNGGCAILGCPNAPVTGASPPGGAPAPPPTPPAPQPQPQQWIAPPQGPVAAPPPPLPDDSRSSTILAVAVIVLALVIAGAAAAIVVKSRSQPQAGPTDTAQPPPPPDAPPPPPAATAAATREQKIQDVLRRYYGAVSTGDFQRAWSLLSPTYKSWKEAGNGGYPKWQDQEHRNEVRLRGANGLIVSERSFARGSGVATIFVSGMRFIEPDGSVCSYEGITWARRLPEGWLYDQGYRQNAVRSARWRPRRTETLGYRCESSY